MADSSYYAKKKAESDKKIQDALKAREARTTNAESSNAKSSDSKISAALEARSQRVQNSLPDVAADIQKALTVEIDFYNGTTPTYGAYEDTYKSQRERRINISNLRDRVKAYSGYMDSSVVDYIISTLDKMESGYDAYLGMSQFQSEDDFNEAVEQAKADAKRWSELTGGYDSSKHQAEGESGWNDYVETQERIAKNKEQAEEETPWWEKLLGYLGDAGQDTSLPLHTTETARQGYRDWEAGMNKPDERWTEEQRFTYGYLWNTSRSKAAEYAYAVNNMLNTQQEQQQVQEIQGWATENFGAGAGNTAAAILTAPLGMADYLGDLISQGTLGYIPEADGQITPFEYSQTVTSGISQYLNETGGTLNENIPIIGGRGWGDVYGLGTSILQSAAAAYSGGSAQALITFFGSASASGVDDALSRGATGDQALMYGSAVGAAEALAEMIGVDNLLKIGSAATLRQLLWNILKQGGAEAMEEGLTSFLGNIADNVIMGDKSHFYLNVAEYQKAGLSEEEAKKKAWGKMWGDMAYDMLGGFVSGSVHAGPQTAYQTIKSNGEMKANYGASQNELVSEALEINPDNAFAQKMQGRLDAGKNLSGSQLSRLVQQNEAALTAQDMSSIQSATEARLSELGETGDVAAIAAALTKQAAGEKLSRAEQQAIANSKYGQRVANELNTENISSGEYASAWAENIGTERINAEEYSRLVEAAQLHQETTGSAGSQVVSPTATNRGNRTVEQQPKSQYDVSDDGKMFLKSDPDKTINVTGVESVKDGKLILKTKDGTVASNEVVYATKADALIYEAVANMGATPASAWTMINSFKESDGVSAQDYATLLPLAYKYGKNNYRNGLLKLDLTPKQSSIAFQMGREDAAAAVKPTTQVSTKFTLSEKHADKKIIFEGFSYNEKSANDVQKASMAAIDTINKMSSLEIHVYKSVKKNGKLYAIVNGKERLAPNGYFTDGNKVYIDINAGNKGEGLMLYTLSHEIGHYIARYNAQDFKAISDFLFEHYGKDVLIDMLLENQKHKLRKSYETDGKAIPSESVLEKEAKEELVCDMLSRMLADKNAYDKLMALKQKDLNAFQKLGQAIKKALDKLAKIIGVYDTQNPDFMYAASVENFGEEAFRQLQDLYIKAFVQADANYQAEVGQKNTTQEGGVNHDTAVKNSERIVDQIRGSLAKIMELDSVYTIDASNATPYTADRKTDEKSGHSVFKSQGGVANRPGFGRVVLSKRGAVQTIHHGNGPAKQAAFPAIKAVIEHGVEIYRDKNHNGQGYDTVTFSAPITFFGNDAPLAVVVKAFDSANADKTFYVHEICDSEGNYIQLADEDSKKTSSTNFVEPTSTVSAADGENISKNSIRNERGVVKNKSTEAIDLNVDEKTESVAPSVLMSERTWTESDYVQEREQAAKEIAKAIGVSVKKAKAYIDSVNSIAKMIAEDRVRLDYFYSPGRSSFVGNVEYGGSFDFSTLCKKRRLLTGTFTAIQKALPNTALTADEILDIRNRMKDAGLEVSCGLCYVEGSRANMGQFAKEFLRLYKQYYPDAWQPNMADVNTPDGIEWVRINHPECYEQYEYFWNHYGTLKDGDKNLFASQQKPKLYQLHTEYKGEILEKFNDDDNVEEKNLNGGIRLQSFSDFEIVHLIDTMQIIMDMSRVGLAGQAYTKVPDFAWALGDTGLKINLSLIAKGVDANGKLIFDDVEGMPIDKAVELRNRYSKNVGTILVAFNDEQLLAAMADERVDYIIPFHRSQWKKSQYGAMGLPTKTKDYTYMQNEKFIKPQYHEYRGRMVKDKATNYMPNEYWDFSKSGKENAEAYLEMCARNNKRPKFYKLLQNNGDGSYSLKADGSTDGYWKLLIDFKMYDNNGVGSPQMPVKPDFNMDEATRMLDEYSGGHSNFPVAQGVVDSFVEEYKDSHKGVQFSDRDNAPIFYSQMAKVVDGVKQDKLGAASVVSMLRGKGVKAEEIKWSGIETFLEGKKSVTKAELQEFIAGSMLNIEEKVLDGTEKVDVAVKRIGWGKLGVFVNGNQIDTLTKDAYGIFQSERNPHNQFASKEKVESYWGRYAKNEFGNDPKFKPFTLDGGTNYREILFNLPGSEHSNNAMKTHWGKGAKGVLAHARVQDFNTFIGKMLFIEEIQSDWHNEGHTKGYESAEYKEAERVSDELFNEYQKMRRPFNQYVRSSEFNTDPEDVRKKKFDLLRSKAETAEKKWKEAERRVESLLENGAGIVPDAPFRDNYHEYVLKRLLREASEKGYDSIGWTTADIQMDRWNHTRLTNAELGISDAKNPNAVAFEEGYRIEYDQDIPKFLRKYGKKWGTSVGKTVLDNGTEVWSMAITDEMKDSVMTEGQALYSDRDTAALEAFGTTTNFEQAGFVLGDGRMLNLSQYGLNGVKHQRIEQVYDDVKGSEAINRFIQEGHVRIKASSPGIEIGSEVAPTVSQMNTISRFINTSLVKKGYFYLDITGKNGETIASVEYDEDASTEDIIWDIKDYYNRGKVPKERRTLFQDRDSDRDTVDNSTLIGKNNTINKRGDKDVNSMKRDGIDTQIEQVRTSLSILEKNRDINKGWAKNKHAELTQELDDLLIKKYGVSGRHEQLLDALTAKEEELEDARFSNADKSVIEKLEREYSNAENALDVFADKYLATDYYRDSFLVGDDGFLFQDRADNSVSNRSLLANAFEGVAQNEIEKNKIWEYKGKIDLINAEEQKLSELNEKIKDLSFAKGPRDTKAIRDLQFEARQTANRISTYDKQLLRLEASKPLQDVLQREKKMAYKRAEQKGKEALEAYREKTMKTQRELLEKWQESRKKGIDSRNRTAMRHKIKDVVNELNQYLLRGTKERHVPIELQKAVAEALDAVNMDTVGAEERIAKLKDELLKAKTPEQIQEISRKIDHIQAMGDKMNGRLQKLKEAYDQFVNSDDPLIANSHDEVISNKLQSVIDSIGNTPLRDMTFNQLEDVYDMYRMVLTTIRNANKAFKAKKNESISTIANQVMVEVEKVGGKQKQSLAMLNGIKSFGWNNLKPVYAFEHIGSEHFTEVFNNVRAGEDVWAVDVTEAREFYLDKSKKHNYDSWDLKKRYNFTSTSGMDFELDLEQIMSLYAYSKRDQAADHLKKGGIVFDESTKIIKKTKAGISLEFNPTEATAYNISEETLADIVSKLTGEQKAFVDEMQDYLSTVMGAKGNEVSLEMYGVKLFKEKFYFPLKSAQQFMAKAKEQQQGEAKIKNSGFSKETVQKASNPIVLTPFMNVWADHVNEMSMYHAFVLPMEDFYRVYNYKTPTSDTMATESVEMFIQNAYGKGATKYIDQLLKDLNGGARSDTTTGVINKMIGLFKKGAVFASLSVVIQQPSAIARALALVDSKYFIGQKVDHKRHKVLWDEVKQYAPVAIIKEMGYFDTHMGKSTQDFIIGKEYSSFKDKMSALVKDSDYRDEVLSKAPALADEIAWCGIWEAVKRELKAKNPGMDVKSEAFLKMAGERFTEVIVKTQVYDSVLSRSGMMRSKDTGMKMATSFMAEPTTSINMVADALLQGKRGNRKYARAAIGAVIASQILNSILVSFVYAGRDDDEEETYWEKYIGTLSGEVLDSLNPLTYIPFIKDIVSIVQGYDVERSDMSVISDLWKAWENLSKDNVSAYRKVEGFAGSIAQIFGLPVKNIMRDARGIYQTVMSFVDGEHTTAAGIVHAIKGSITGKDVSNGQQLYEAYLSGDADQIARVKSRFDDQNAINNAVRKSLRENDPRIKEAAIAWNANDLDEYMRIAKEIIAEKHFVQDDVVMAIRSEANALAPDADSETQSKAKGLFTAEKFAAAIAQGDQAMANAIKTDILQSAVKNGKTAEEAVKSFNSSAKTELKELYLTGDITEQEAINALTTYCGSDEGSAKADVQYWAFKQDYPDIHADDQWFDTYYEKIADSGIDIDVYMEYRNTVSTITGEGKKEKRMAVINSLPITSAQKDALYFAEGWTSSKLYEAPWH